MQIACPKEIKPQEYRVGLPPQAAREVISHVHRVVIESGAGLGAGFTDDDYRAAVAAAQGLAAITPEEALAL